MSPLASRYSFDATCEQVAGTDDVGPDFVHPETGLANDYLNIFNELVMLLEVLPTVPDFQDEILRWKPVSYVEYFNQSPLSKGRHAIEVYRQLDASLRNRFDKKVADLNAAANIAIKRVRDLMAREPMAVEGVCARSAERLRYLLDEAGQIVNNGEHSTHDQAQKRADRLVSGPKSDVSAQPLQDRRARG